MTFAHIDADAFFASALQRKYPSLRGKPLLALGMGGGCVIAASYEAKAFGIKTGMRLVEARKLCPSATAVPSDFREACAASQEIEDILKEQCPVLEKYSVDEWFAELKALVGGIPKNCDEWAQRMQTDVSNRVGLTVSIGIGSTITLSKMASEYRKPAGVTVITDNEAFLRDRPAAAIPGIGPRRELHAESEGWHTAWDFAQADAERVSTLFGKSGRELQSELQGTAVYDIQRAHVPPKSISRCRSFRATTDQLVMFSHLLDHLTFTVMKMRREHLMCTEIQVWLRDATYKHAGRRCKLPQPMDTEEQILVYLRSSFTSLIKEIPRSTQAGFCVAGLRPKATQQFSLFEAPEKTKGSEDMQSTLDSIHDRYGRDAIVRASATPTKGDKKASLNVIE
ncbi:MAG: DNA polymerase IV [bacterium]|nr:DNA polymerase IV [bacterium]